MPSRARGMLGALSDYSAAVTLLIFGTLSLPAFAQIPAHDNSGVLLREEERDERKPLEEPKSPIEIPLMEQSVPPEANEIRFKLEEVTFDGATVFPQAELDAEWQPLRGTDVSLADLYQVASRITTKYRDAGYVLSFALVPAQSVDDGRVRIQVVEGYVDQVSIEGDQPRFRSFVQQQGEKIRASRPLQAKTLERALLLINDLPGMNARAVLAPGDSQGASKLSLQLTQNYVDLFGQVNNFGSRFNGPLRLDGGISLQSLLGLHESTNFRTSNTVDSEFHLFQLSQTHFVGGYGTQLSGSVSWVTTDPGSSTEDLDIEGDSFGFAVDLSHPLIRTRASSLNGFMLFDFLNSDTEQPDNTTASDHLRVLRAGGTFDFLDSFRGINRFDLTVSQGLPILDYSKEGDPNNSRLNGAGNHGKIDAAFSRLQGLFGRLNLLIEVEGQYAFNDMLVSEEFVFGGRRIGRGYDVGEISGDHGFATLAELQYGLDLPFEYPESVQLYSSWDQGFVWNNESDVPDGHTANASSVAGGARVNFTTWLSGDAEISYPLSKKPQIDDEGREPRFYFSVTVRWPAN